MSLSRLGSLPGVSRFPRPAPGSTLWLLIQEFRLFKRGAGIRRRALIIGILTVLVLGHAISAPLGLMWHRIPVQAAIAKLVVLSVLCPVIFLMMLGPAIMQMINALFIRGDFDLLLSAPIRPQVILPVRAGAVALAALMGWLMLISGIADTGLYLGHANWLVAYPVFTCLALLATTAALLITLGLVRWVGVKRTRAIAQILTAILGLGGAIAGQAPRLLHLDTSLDAHPPTADGLWLLPGRFMQGDPVLLLPLLILAPLLFWITTRRLAPYFTTAAVTAGSFAASGNRRAQAPTTIRFAGSRVLILVRHELRIIRRNPHLPRYLLEQVGSVLPLAVALLVNNKRDAGNMATVAAIALVLMTAYLTGALIKLVRGDDVGDLALSAPIAHRHLQYTKLAAAILPPLALLIVGAGIMAVAVAAWQGVVVVLCGLGAMATAVLSSLWVRPGMASLLLAQRRFGKNKGSGKAGVRQVGEIILALGWAGTAALAMADSPYSLLVAAGLLGGTMILKAPL